jgi:hypothetical protein
MRDLWWIKWLLGQVFLQDLLFSALNISAATLQIHFYFNNILRRTADEAWEPSNKTFCFGYLKAFDRKVLSDFFLFKGLNPHLFEKKNIFLKCSSYFCLYNSYC